VTYPLISIGEEPPNVRRRTFVLSVLVALPLAFTATPAALAAGTGVQIALGGEAAIDGSYIVTVKDGVDPTLVALAATITPKFVYTSAINGFAGQVNDAQLAVLQRHPDVVAIEQDQIATSTASYSTVHSGWDTWGLDRIDSRNLPLSNTYNVNGTGSGVHAYVFDSGMRFSHLVFSGRASNHYDAFGGNGSDCNGHGSHVAGTLGGLYQTTVTGVATGVTLHSVKVLDCAGNGPISGIISAIDFVKINHSNPAVANMSLGVNGISSSLDTAVGSLISSGVTTVIAAGNASQNACNYSPSRVTAGIIVAASSKTDRRATFSNHGSCVDLYGPGVDVWSAWHDGDGNLARISGTSQATPHVAGVAALHLATNPNATPADVQSFVVGNATPNVISQNRTGTPNLLLYMGGM
jgi:subtilisin family serine protease